MTLVSTIIRDAYRESTLIAITAEPTEPEKLEGLSLLNRLVASVFGNEAGEQLDPIIIGRNNINRPQGFPWYAQVPDQSQWFVPPNARLILNLTSAQTVYLDPNPEDGARFAYIDSSANLATYNLTINANGRRIGAALSLVVNTNSAKAEYIYRADLGAWMVVTPLVAADTFPFPMEFEDLFVTGLSFRLNPRHAQQADQQTVQTYTRALRQFKARYRQHEFVGSELGLLRTLGVRNRYNGDTRYDNAAWAAGRPFLNRGIG